MRNYDDRIFKIPFEKTLKIYAKDIEKEFKQDQTEKRWSLYASIYPFMLLGNLKPLEFSEFENLFEGHKTSSVNKPKVDKFAEMSEEDILKYISEMEKKEVITEKTTGQNLTNRW